MRALIQDPQEFAVSFAIGAYFTNWYSIRRNFSPLSSVKATVKLSNSVVEEADVNGLGLVRLIRCDRQHHVETHAEERKLSPLSSGGKP